MTVKRPVRTPFLKGRGGGILVISYPLPTLLALLLRESLLLKPMQTNNEMQMHALRAPGSH